MTDETNYIDVQNTVIAIISDITDTQNSTIELCDRLSEIGVDSLMTVELLIEIEEIFGITFIEEDLKPSQISTVDSVIQLTSKYIGK